MWDGIIYVIAQILTFIANLVGDWGLAIIILTAIIRILLTPLTVSSTRSMAKMQVLQPKMLEIQERYADDPQRMNLEMQKFYSENKFNPLGGCLPTLIQMPVFFALFSVLRYQIPESACFYGIFESLALSPNGAVLELGWAGAWIYIVFDLAFGVLTLHAGSADQDHGYRYGAYDDVVRLVCAHRRCSLLRHLFCLGRRPADLHHS